METQIHMFVPLANTTPSLHVQQISLWIMCGTYCDTQGVQRHMGFSKAHSDPCWTGQTWKNEGGGGLELSL